jgi:sugar phosphate isomerase/epimerase
MKAGVSTYSFSRLMNQEKMTQFDTIGKAAEIGFDVIEFSNLFVPGGMSKESYAKNARSECERCSIGIGNYTIGADFLNCEDSDWKKEVERLKAEVDIAYILGSKGMRHDATKGYPASKKGAAGFDNALPLLIKACREVTEYAAEKGIRTMVENHGFFCQDSIRVEALVNGVDHENFGVLLDIGNFLCVDENPPFAVGRLSRHISHVHVKDFHYKKGDEPDPGKGWFSTRGGSYLRGSVLGHGQVPVKQCLEIIKRSGYDGVVSIEFEGMEDPIEALEIGLENLKKYWA